MEKKQRGGARPGAGRKRMNTYTGNLRTVTIRLPQDQIDEIGLSGNSMTQFYIQAAKEKLIRDKLVSSG